MPAQRYPLPYTVLFRLIGAILTRRRLSFRQEAEAAVKVLDPPLRVAGTENGPRSGPALITINHYWSPTFRSWWLTLAVSAQVPMDVHWIIASAWTSPGWLYSHTISPLSRWAFPRLAHAYGFTAMPPMPPAPKEVEERARAVREVLAYARRAPAAVIGLAPEGGDSLGGVINTPPPGVGRFILQLARLELPIYPVGIYEEEGRICLNFGEAYRLEGLNTFSSEERDRQAARQAMMRIACLLPERLRGDFG